MIKALYQTSDGETFTTLQEAEEHEAKKFYKVFYTLEGFVCVNVCAKDEKEAKIKAVDMWYDSDIDWTVEEVTVEEE